MGLVSLSSKFDPQLKCASNSCLRILQAPTLIRTLRTRGLSTFTLLTTRTTSFWSLRETLALQVGLNFSIIHSSLSSELTLSFPFTGTGTIGTPATAKNCIAVGASMNTAEAFQEAVRTTNCPDKQGGTECEDNLASFSSVGPCSDGRICPDLVAPGYYIMSARSATNPTAKTCGAQNTDKRIVRMAGTSMATPVAAGNAALVRQYFEDGFYPLGRKKVGSDC